MDASLSPSQMWVESMILRALIWLKSCTHKEPQQPAASQTSVGEGGREPTSPFTRSA